VVTVCGNHGRDVRRCIVIFGETFAITFIVQRTAGFGSMSDNAS
jgi:hypothetical protein